MWTKEQANQWYARQPYFFGANFTPSSAINQLEMWQAESFDLPTIRRDLGFAAGIGMNIMRVYLHDLPWEQDSAGFCQRIGQYLDVADSLRIKTMFVLFDDCWAQTFSLGKQPDPRPYTHNSGWVQSPGVRVVNDPQQWGRIQKYTTQLLTTFKDDPRIAAWDLYNEPGNGTTGDNSAGSTKQGERSLPLLKAVYDWARNVSGLTQPITSAIWTAGPEFTALNQFALDNSDIISFHNYGPAQPLAEMIQKLTQHGRPMICSEYMARGAGSTLEHCLPILKKYNVGAINWGLVAGKTQTIYPWGWNASKGEPDILFHDIFWPNGRFLYPREESAIKQILTPA
jgi:Cellulase (glycosyl hydrolase family 5)